MTPLEIIAIIVLAYLAFELLAQYIGTLYFYRKKSVLYTNRMWIPGYYVWHFFANKTWRNLIPRRNPAPEITEEV